MKSLLLFTLIFVSSVVMAQPSGGGPLTPTPIGFTEVLVIGALGMGVAKKVRSRKLD